MEALRVGGLSHCSKYFNVMDGYRVELLSKEEYANYDGSRLVKVVSEDCANQRPDVISSFYSILTKSNYLNFLIDTFLGAGNYKYEINFYQGPVDEEEVKVAYNEISFWVSSENQKLSEDRFWEINLEFSKKLLSAIDVFDLSELEFKKDLARIIACIELKILRLEKRKELHGL